MAVVVAEEEEVGAAVGITVTTWEGSNEAKKYATRATHRSGRGSEVKSNHIFVNVSKAEIRWTTANPPDNGSVVQRIAPATGQAN